MLEHRLDPGEASVLAAAHRLGPDTLAILDDLDARRAATDLGIRFVGTAGLLIEAKRRRLIRSCAAELDKLLQHGFFVSDDLVKLILDRAGAKRRG